MKGDPTEMSLCERIVKLGTNEMHEVYFVMPYP